MPVIKKIIYSFHLIWLNISLFLSVTSWPDKHCAFLCKCNSLCYNAKHTNFFFVGPNNCVKTHDQSTAAANAATDVWSMVYEDREMSIPRRSQQMVMCYSTIWKILRVDLGLNIYKIHLLQELKPNTYHNVNFFVNRP